MSRIALYGHTDNENYGSLLTYYSLYKTIEECGGDVTIIPRSNSVKNGAWNTYNSDSHASIFFNTHCKKAEVKSFDSFYEYNKDFDTFVVGSDMIWKHKQYASWSKDTFYLNFVNSDKKKVAFSTSFGTDDIYKIIDEEDINRVAKLISRFNYISLREFSGIPIIKNLYGINNATQIPDPVFLNTPEFYKDIAKEYQAEKKDIFCYLATKTFVSSSKNIIAKEMIKNKFSSYYRILDGHGSDIGVQQFLHYLINSKIVITDSYHGVCLSLILNKPFIYLDRGHSTTRIDTLNELFNIEIKDGTFTNLDWNLINKKLLEIRSKGRELIKNIVL